MLEQSKLGLHARKFWCGILVVGVLATLSGCGGEDYKPAKACLANSDDVAALVDTESFTVDSNDQALPLKGNQPVGSAGYGDYVCRVDVDGERAFSIVASVEPPDFQAQRRAGFERNYRTATHANGLVAIDPDTSNYQNAGWVCGQVTVLLEGQLEGERPAKAIVAIVKSVADEVGCWPN